MKPKDSMIASQHKGILGRIEEYLDPGVLLKENWDLLYVDFQWLARGLKQRNVGVDCGDGFSYGGGGASP
jgi:hypothetical protein